MKKSRPLLIIVILAILNQSAHADQEQSETKKDTTFNELQKMVVTATKTSRKTSELSLLDMNNPVHHVIEQTSIMGDDHERFPASLKLFFKLLDGF